MPVFTHEPNEVMKIPGSSFQFSAISPNNLVDAASSYTLATIVVDVTGSVAGFKDDLLKMTKEVIKACQKAPTSENIMVRLMAFDTGIYELHGYKLLNEIDADKYAPFNIGGMTALFDATFESIGATIAYSQNLIANDFTVNGCVYIITDGGDNASRFTPKMIKAAIEKSRQAEVIESLITVLIGLNTQQCGQYLKAFKDEADLTQYIDMGDVSASKLAKLGGMISKSVSSQSQALGSGGPSQPIQLTI